MEENYREALSEIYEILLYIDKESFDELPFEVIYKITENKSKKYEFKIDENEKQIGEIIENKIKEETKEMLAYLYLKYWNQKEDDKDLQDELNAIEETMKIQKIYDVFTLDMENPILPDIEEATENEDTKVEEKENTDNSLLPVEKENIFSKIKKLILKLFKKFGKKE